QGEAVDKAIAFFFSGLVYNFYGVFAVLGTLLFSLGLLPWIGSRMRAARERALTTGALDAPGAEPMLREDDAFAREAVTAYRPSLIDFFAPMGTLLGVAIVPYVLHRLGAIEQGNWIFEAFA